MTSGGKGAHTAKSARRGHTTSLLPARQRLCDESFQGRYSAGERSGRPPLHPEHRRGHRCIARRSPRPLPKLLPDTVACQWPSTGKRSRATPARRANYARRSQPSPIGPLERWGVPFTSEAARPGDRPAPPARARRSSPQRREEKRLLLVASIAFGASACSSTVSPTTTTRPTPSTGHKVIPIRARISMFWIPQ